MSDKPRLPDRSEAAEAARVLLRRPAVVVVTVNPETMRWELHCDGESDHWRYFSGVLCDAMVEVLKRAEPPTAAVLERDRKVIEALGKVRSMLSSPKPQQSGGAEVNAPAPSTKSPFGPKPELTWLPVEKLHVDLSYQRSLSVKRSQKLIAAIAQEFNWFLFGTLIVVRGLADYLIIDGQHRAEAAKRRALVEVPCALFPNAPLALQAKAFVDANRCRIAVSQFAIFHAQQLAGDPQARTIADVCAESGVSIPRTPGTSAALKPGETLALGAIKALIATHGGGVAVSTLSCLREAMPEPGALRAHYITALGNLVRSRPELSLPKLKAALAEQGFDAMEKRVLNRAMERAETKVVAAEAAFLDLVGLPPQKPGASAPGRLLAPAGQGRRAEPQGGAFDPEPATGFLKPGFAARVAVAAKAPAAPKSKAAALLKAVKAEPEPGPQAETEADTFTVALQRRCPCGVVFKTRHANQIHCEKCATPTPAPHGRAGGRRSPDPKDSGRGPR